MKFTVDQFGNQWNYFNFGPTVIWAKSKQEWYFIRGQRIATKELYHKIMNWFKDQNEFH